MWRELGRDQERKDHHVLYNYELQGLMILLGGILVGIVVGVGTVIGVGVGTVTGVGTTVEVVVVVAIMEAVRVYRRELEPTATLIICTKK